MLLELLLLFVLPPISIETAADAGVGLPNDRLNGAETDNDRNLRHIVGNAKLTISVIETKTAIEDRTS